MNSSLPSAKVSVGALTGAVVTALVFILNYWVLGDKPIPGELAAMLTFIFSGLASYITPPSRADVGKVD